MTDKETDLLNAVLEHAYLLSRMVETQAQVIHHLRGIVVAYERKEYREANPNGR